MNLILLFSSSGEVRIKLIVEYLLNVYNYNSLSSKVGQNRWFQLAGRSNLASLLYVAIFGGFEDLELGIDQKLSLPLRCKII